MTRTMSHSVSRPLWATLTISGWHGATSSTVILVRDTRRRALVRAICRTKLGGRGRWLEAGAEAWVPRSAVMVSRGPHGAMYPTDGPIWEIADDLEAGRG